MKIKYTEDSIPAGPDGTRELFEKVINTRGIYAKLKMSMGAVSQMRIQFKKGTVSIDRMHHVLKISGYEICQTEQWKKKEPQTKVLFDNWVKNI